MASNKRKNDTSQVTAFALDGERAIEAIGEFFIADRFIPNCAVPDKVSSAARVERFTRSDFPRILLDLSEIDRAISLEQINADIRYLADVFERNPRGFAQLFALRHNPVKFAAKARRLKLTEVDSLQAGGGLLWLIVLVGAALVLTGCPGGSTACGAVNFKLSPRTYCVLRAGHTGRHRDSLGNLY